MVCGLIPFPLRVSPLTAAAIKRDLADIHNDGRLTQDGFAIALHLINSKLTGKEIPESLPQSLVPPSMRQTSQPQRCRCSLDYSY